MEEENRGNADAGDVRQATDSTVNGQLRVAVCETAADDLRSSYPFWMNFLNRSRSEAYRVPCIPLLWDELAHYPPARADEACRHLLRTVSGWIGATHAAWLGSVRVLDGTDAENDPLFGWRVKTILFEPPLPKIILMVARMLLARNGRDPGMTVVAMARRSGTVRVNRLRDGFIDFDAFQKTEHYNQHYRRFKVNDRLWIGSPISETTESFVVFDKREPGKYFTEEDAELAATVMRGLTWFQLSLLLNHGIGLTTSPLTPMERRILRLLLTDKSEKQIAAALNQSANTTHGHIRNVFRKFGVRSRHALMALWLSPP